MNRLLLLAACLLCGALHTSAQNGDNSANEKGKLSGDLQLNYNYYQRDSAIGASGNPLYDNLLSGGEGWMNLRYEQGTFAAGVRLEVFQNSNLHTPGTPFTGQGLGFFYFRKGIDNDKLRITGGYFYEQFGSGIALRAYEDRALGIDNSILGLNAQWRPNDWLTIKALAGKQKDRFNLFNPIIKGFNAEANFSLDSSRVRLAPGVAVVNRTLDQGAINDIVTRINAQPTDTRFVPTYNTYAFSAYNTLTYRSINWTAEYDYKTAEAINDAKGDLINKSGTVAFTSLGYSRRGFGATVQYKRTEGWVFRTSPSETLLRGMVSFLPPMARTNSFRLPARYVPASQELGEQAYQADVIWSPNDHLTFATNYSNITDLNGNELFRELYQDVTWKHHKGELKGGIQFVNYNQTFYQQKPNYPVVRTFTPFVEYTAKLSRRKSVRFELQYMFTDRDHTLFKAFTNPTSPAEQQDFGDWAFALLEFNIAPHWSFAASDMYNIRPTHTEALHYPNVFAAYTFRTSRLTVSYSKQVEGVVCTGGVCRYEPAFSGVKMGLTTSF